MKTPVPFDILAYITNILAVKSNNKSLRALSSRICKFTVPLCRQYLFSSIELMSSTTPKEIGLTRLLSRPSDTTFRIKNMAYLAETPTPMSQHVLDIFKVIRNQPTSLQSIILSSLGWPDRNVLQEPTKSLLISLIQFPTVTRLQLGDIDNIPLVTLSLSGPTDFSASSASEAASPHSVQRVTTRSKIPSPISLRIRGFHSAISARICPPSPNVIDSLKDFGRLEEAYFNIHTASEASQMAEFLKTATQLQTLSIGCMYGIVIRLHLQIKNWFF